MRNTFLLPIILLFVVAVCIPMQHGAKLLTAICAVNSSCIALPGLEK